MHASLAATVAKSAPAYCTSGTGVHTPAQWATCAKLGWSQPVTGAAHAGAAVGHYAGPGIALAIAIIAVLFLLSKTGRSTVPQRS